MARNSRSQSKAIGDALRAELAKIAVATVLEIDANLRAATPVATGHARANWVPSVGAPHSGEDAGAAQAAGVGSVLSYKLEQGPLWESNNVSYIPRLNAGSSTQAPALFIEAAIDQANATMQERYGNRAIRVDANTGTAGKIGAIGAGNLASAYSPFSDED